MGELLIRTIHEAHVVLVAVIVLKRNMQWQAFGLVVEKILCDVHIQFWST